MILNKLCGTHGLLNDSYDEIELGSEHMVMLTLDNGRSGLSKNLRPVLPLIVNW